MFRLTSGRLVSIAMVAIIVGLAVWRLMNSTQTWWTIVVAALAIVGVGAFVYYMMSGKKEDGEE
ncbi:hypothetical protein ACFLVP_03245 [Chloroflexota bacterium]